MVSNHCQQLLDNGLEYNVTYGDRLTNHLPMGLIALDRMGASTSQLDDFFQSYKTRLEPISPVATDESSHPPPQSHSRASSQEDTAQLQAYRQGYLEQIDASGLDATLRQALPLLIPGIAASGFHCLIRLAYAIEAKHTQEIACALAYWRLHYFSLGDIKPQVDSKPMTIMRMMGNVVRRHRFGAGVITDRMSEVIELPEYAEMEDQPSVLTIDAIADCAVRIYQMTRDFTMLHGVTGSHALQVILPWCDDQELALRYYWQALLVAYLTTGAVPLHPVSPQASEMTWDEVLGRCCHSLNDHLIKLCYSCWQLHRTFKDPRYLQVASGITRE